MSQSDLASLLQLAVGLNLGFGALLSFVESTKKKRDSSLYSIETNLLLLSEKQKLHPPSQDEISDIFDIVIKYRKLRRPTPVTAFEFYIWDAIVLRFVFLLISFFAFIGLVWCSLDATSPASTLMIVLSIFVNAIPLLAATALLFLSVWYDQKVLPLTDEIQRRLFRYHEIIGEARSGLNSSPERI